MARKHPGTVRARVGQQGKALFNGACRPHLVVLLVLRGLLSSGPLVHNHHPTEQASFDEDRGRF